ncbi:MAG: archaeosine biosynthesis radical SAM protein RaSEA [Thermoplasmatales archaeon]|nr:MAG: archaeosine biosynthesis radical SAM protein RaSEA [Thermoplasmatales archaeon]
MNELTQLCKLLKKDFTPRICNPSKPVRCWSEKDILDGKMVDAYVIIFRTRGCSWALKSGCTMCGYFNDSLWSKVSDKDLLKQFDKTMENYSGEKFVKIFTSGSFLDDNEIKPVIRNKILRELAEEVDKVSVESRPEYITDERLSTVKEIFQSKSFEIGCGLETANNFVREHAINKGFTFNEYKKAALTMKKFSLKLKTYILIKPLFLTEKESINDSISTGDKIKKYTDTISFNPTNVQRNTVVEYLWKRKQYRPAWLWSIVEVLKTSKNLTGNIRIQCDIAGGGSIRGAHNCNKCDRKFLDAIADFSLLQDTKVFEDLDCTCREKWLDQLNIENLSFGSLVDFSGRYQ